MVALLFHNFNNNYNFDWGSLDSHTKFSIVKEAKSELSTNLSFIVILLPIPILSIIILFGLLIGNNNDKISEITITISVIFKHLCNFSL